MKNTILAVLILVVSLAALIFGLNCSKQSDNTSLGLFIALIGVIGFFASAFWLYALYCQYEEDCITKDAVSEQEATRRHVESAKQ